MPVFLWNWAQRKQNAQVPRITDGIELFGVSGTDAGKEQVKGMGNHRKRKNGLGERMLAAFLALAMVFTMLPMDGLQVRAKAEEAEPEFVLKAFHMTNNYVGSETHFNQAPSASIDWEFKNLPEPDGTFSYDLYIYVSPLSPADI